MVEGVWRQDSGCCSGKTGRTKWEWQKGRYAGGIRKSVLPSVLPDSTIFSTLSFIRLVRRTSYCTPPLRRPFSALDNPFHDVAKDAWYAQSVAWAANVGVVGGYGNETFGPDAELYQAPSATSL